MLLRESSSAAELDTDVRAVTGTTPGGVPHGAELLAFAEAACRLDDSLPDARAAVAALGPEALGQAAATVAIFRALNLTADATGIPLGSFSSRAGSLPRTLGFDRFATAANAGD